VSVPDVSQCVRVLQMVATGIRASRAIGAQRGRVRRVGRVGYIQATAVRATISGSRGSGIFGSSLSQWRVAADE